MSHVPEGNAGAKGSGAQNAQGGAVARDRGAQVGAGRELEERIVVGACPRQHMLLALWEECNRQQQMKAHRARPARRRRRPSRSRTCRCIWCSSSHSTDEALRTVGPQQRQSACGRLRARAADAALTLGSRLTKRSSGFCGYARATWLDMLASALNAMLLGSSAIATRFGD